MPRTKFELFCSFFVPWEHRLFLLLMCRCHMQIRVWRRRRRRKRKGRERERGAGWRRHPIPAQKGGSAGNERRRGGGGARKAFLAYPAISGWEVWRSRRRKVAGQTRKENGRTGDANHQTCFLPPLGNHWLTCRTSFFAHISFTFREENGDFSPYAF